MRKYITDKLYQKYTSYSFASNTSKIASIKELELLYDMEKNFSGVSYNCKTREEGGFVYWNVIPNQTGNMCLYLLNKEEFIVRYIKNVKLFSKFMP